jgi:hypothetical protein
MKLSEQDEPDVNNPDTVFTVMEISRGDKAAAQPGVHSLLGAEHPHPSDAARRPPSLLQNGSPQANCRKAGMGAALADSAPNCECTPQPGGGSGGQPSLFRLLFVIVLG